MNTLVTIIYEDGNGLNDEFFDLLKANPSVNKD